jgi:hypothetical protein
MQAAEMAQKSASSYLYVQSLISWWVPQVSVIRYSSKGEVFLRTFG